MNVNKKIPVVILNGFLGSGKTTLFRNLLYQSKKKNIKVAAVVNDMSALDVDGELLGNLEVIEENNSLLESIHNCVLSSEKGIQKLDDAINKLCTNKSLKLIVIETSGSCHPLPLVEYFRTHKQLMLTKVFALVDCWMLVHDYRYGEQLIPQMQSNLVFLLFKLFLKPKRRLSCFSDSCDYCFLKINNLFIIIHNHFLRVEPSMEKSLDDTFIGAYLEKAKVLERLNRFKEAIDNYNISMAIEGPTAFTYLKIGGCHEKMHHKDKALKYFFNSVKEDPAFDKGWIQIAHFYFSKKDDLKALFYVNKAIDIDDENVSYWLFYSKTNHRLNYLEEAERGFKKTLELGGTSLDIWIQRGDVLIELGEIEAAKYNFVQALEYYPESEELEFRLSGLCFKLNDTEAGFAHLLNGLHINSEHIFIIEELFPDVYKSQNVIQFIESYKKSDN